MSTTREEFYRIRGIVIDSRTRRGIQGLRVEAWDKDLLVDDCLGSAVADAEGAFEIPFTPQHFREFFLDRRPDLYFRVYRGDELLTSTENAVLRDVGDGDIPVTIAVADGPEQSTPAGTVEGHVVLEHGTPAEGLTLRLYRHGFGGVTTQVGETTTGAQGRYSLAFGADDGRGALEVRAVDTAGKEVPLSKRLFDLAGPAPGELNLVATAELHPLAPEWDRLSADLVSQVDHIGALAEARENAERQDLTVLNRATGWDARLIGLAATAARLSADEEIELSQDTLYALLRAGLPSDKLLLAQVHPDAAEQALKKVRDAGIVGLSDPQIAAARRQFASFAGRVRLSVPVPGATSTYGELLQSSGLPPETQSRFASVYLDHRGDAAGLWDKARAAGLGDAQIATLQLHGKLSFLAGNSAAVTAHLMEQQIQDPVHLVERDLHDPERWKAEVRTVAGGREEELAKLIPVRYTGGSVAERLDAYAEDMARKVRLSYPTHVIARTLEQDGADAFRLGEGRVATATLLKRAAGQGFRLGQTPVTGFLRTHEGVTTGISDAETTAARQQLKALHRTYQITPGNEGMPVLHALGMTSAYDVTAQPEDAFLRLYDKKYMEIHGRVAPKAEARLVYRKAKQVSSVTYSLFATVSRIHTDPPVGGFSGSPAVVSQVRNELIRQIPSMESLFGSLDFGECEHCQSVLSPAAYFVDLLQFIDPEPGLWSNFLAQWEKTHGTPYTAKYRKPYDALIERRPDLPHVQLTCQNTETALPYIDLVNEILEYYVANGKLTEEAAHNTGDATTPELLAEPQNVIGAAYEVLRNARYPSKLPFDLWLETVRDFCSRYETPLAKVLDVFRAGDELFAPAQPLDHARVFAESLGLSPAETEIFTDPDPLGNDRWHELYGLPVARPAIQAPTNGERAALTIPNADADSFGEGMACAYFDVSAGALHPERQTIAEIGSADSGGAGRAKVTFAGIWKTPPDAGDLLVCDGVATLESARALSRRLGITYKELVEIVRCGFVNPELPRLGVLQRLGVGISDARSYLADRALLPLDPDTLSTEDRQRRLEAEAFADALTRLASEFTVPQAQLESEVEGIPFDRVLVLADPDAGASFDLTTLRYADTHAADPVSLLRINLFVRLWRKLGWSIEETDRALQAFVPANAPFTAAHLAERPLATALVYLAHLKRLDQLVPAGKQSRLKLLALWSDLATTGKKPLYAQLFLTRGMLKADPAFDDPLGRYLSPAVVAAMAGSRTHAVQLGGVAPADRIDPAPFAAEPRLQVRYDALQQVQHLSFSGVLGDADKATLGGLSASPALPQLLDAVQAKAHEFLLVKGHLSAVQGALGVTASDADRILKAAGSSLAAAELSLPNVSLLFRYSLLAKGLKLSIRELVALQDLSGLDPFHSLHPDPLTALGQDHPFAQTLRFVEVAGEVRDSGLKIDDLEYLLRHRFDETGPYRPNREETLALVKTLAEGVLAIGLEHAVPEDPGAMSDEVLRQKLGLVLPGEVVERFLAMLNGIAEFTATVGAPAPLQPEAFAEEPAIRELRYDDTLKEQKLTFRGMLFDPRKQELLARLPAPVPPNPHVPSPVLSDLLDAVQRAQRVFFATHLQKRPAGAQPGGGFLDEADYDLVFDPDRPLDGGETEQDRLRKRRSRLASAFLPFLQERLIRKLVLETLAAHTGADPVLVESLVTDEQVLPGPGPLLDAFAATGERGITATFFANADGTGPPLATLTLADADTSLKDASGRPVRPAGVQSARLEGYLYVPAPGPYRFRLTADRHDTEAELRLDDLPDPVLWSGPAAGGVLGEGTDEYRALKAGVPYRFTLLLRKLSGGEARLDVKGETVPNGRLSQLTLHPGAVVDGAGRAAMLLGKVVLLLQRLDLGEREARYLLTHAAAFDGLNLRKLPVVAGDDTLAGARTLFGQFLRLAAYVRLKHALAPGTSELIDVFEANETGDLDRVYTLFAKLTRREAETVEACARALFTAPAFSSEKPLQLLWDALQVIERLGAPVESLLEWLRVVDPAANPAQRQEAARSARDAVKMRLDPETWQRVAQPIFDRLRQRGRDALAAHVMHQRGFASLEQLYEYFLVDPGMEPVVQTSRIRQAIASVQLFIQRCLLNLEPQAPPSSIINARQWEWMKRYRVWEANRKIFLFPENWLEPEFRDDKTHLFTELEGALLQDDVSADLAEDAFLVYLGKLDELARLEIVAVHLEDNANPAWRTLHVIGRTYAQPYRYFYRRLASDGWTPWEPVTAEIEGDHPAPVVWRDRLYLFWVTFLEKPAPATAPATLQDPAKSVTIPPVRIDVEAQLHWSEYLQGQWSTRSSSGFNTPRPFVRSGLSSFDRQSVFVHVSKAYDPEGEERGVYIHLSDPMNGSFFLAGRNSTPEPLRYDTNLPQGLKPANPYSAGTPGATRYSGNGPLTVQFDQRITTEPGKPPQSETLAVLTEGRAFTLLPCDNNLTLGAPEPRDADDPAAVEAAIKSGLTEIASLMKPIFYQDDVNTFFVEPQVTEQTVEEWQEWVTRIPQPEPGWETPKWWEKLVVVPVVPWKGPVPDPTGPVRVQVDRRSLVAASPEADWLANPGTVLLFDGGVIGPRGGPGLELRTAVTGGPTAAGVVPVSVNPGSGVAPGSAVVLSGITELRHAGLTQMGGGLNVVGASGFNAALRQNVSQLARPGAGVAGTFALGR